ncbi:unnamed protein product [Allacma fusca]|uniref:AAA+ ATPase domain-containing protein n=1 Tax=Allacma fusca TaxID=39272 RepID=A0A8J2P184_9HEXA|nr:unnamed protein product [Allacma fusca]
MSTIKNLHVVYGVVAFGVLSIFIDRYYYPNWLARNTCQIPVAERIAKWKNLERDLPREIFGQHIAIDTVLRAVYSHITNEAPKKGLVLSFHGAVGTGKTFMSQLIAKHLYEGGFESPHVTSFVGPLHFLNDESKLGENQVRLKSNIETAARRCGKEIFIFDEVDKMRPEIFDAIVPYIDYYNAIDGIDYRGLTFIFLSNTGASAIGERMHDLRTIGRKPRETINIEHFREILADKAFKEHGGLFKSSMISQRLVDHFIPFLPLEKEHILMCARRDIVKRRVHFIPPEKVADQIKYIPTWKPIFAEDGCKRVLSIHCNDFWIPCFVTTSNNHSGNFEASNVLVGSKYGN